MVFSGGRYFTGRRPSGRVFFAGVLALGACLVARRASADDLRCETDADCVVTNFDCSECGRCPDSPPLAITPRALKRVEEECKKHPPARLARGPQLARGPMPACSPCRPTLVRTAAPIYRAACVVAWGAGRPSRPRTIAGGYGNPLRVPISENRCQAVIDFYQVTPPSEAPLRGEAAPATTSDRARTCSDADDCTLTNFDCSACGRCPGTPPVALNGQALIDLEAKCRKHPPARLDPKPKHGVPRPKCAKCPSLDPKRPIPWFRVDCIEGQCQVISEPAREQKEAGD